MNITYSFKNIITFLAIWIGVLSYAQEIKVTGKVIDDNGPLPGVNIQVKGTSAGTMTDFDGNFEITTDSNAVLLISSMGFVTQEIKINNRSSITVTMVQDIQSLDAVVVTALGISREKKSLGYATQELDGDEINRANQASVANAISGKVAGVQIRRNTNLGGSTNVIIRGNTSLTGDNQALWIVDGVPVDNTNNSSGNNSYDYGNAGADIDPEDIESMNVLKGAAATALYGSRAANGAIVITTKSGKGRKGIGITVSSGVMISTIDKSTFPMHQQEYGGGYGAVNGPNGDSYFNMADMDGDGVLDLIAPYNQYGGWGAAYDPNLLVYQWNSVYPESPNYGVPTPWVKPEHGAIYMFDSPVTLSNSVSLSGNSEDANYRLSYSNFNQDGIVPNSNVKRDNFSLNSTFNLSEKLTATAGANYVKTTVKGRSKGGLGGSYTNIFTNLRQYTQPSIDYKQLKELYDMTGKNQSPYPGGSIDNPYFIMDQNASDSRNRFIGNASLKYTLTDWIDVTGRVSLDTYTYLQEERLRKIIRNPSLYSARNIFFEEVNYDLMLNFKKNLGDRFNISGVVGTNIRRNMFRSTYSETNNGLIVDGLYSISNSVGTPPAAVEALTKVGVNGLYGLVSFGYDNFLFLDITGRNDWSSTLPADNNSFFYPSIATSFIFSQFIESDILSFGKLRLNYAEVGNSAPAHSLIDVLDKPTPFGSTQLYSVNSTKNNPYLKPENTKSIEAGIETSFFRKRIEFNLSVYKTNTENQIMPVAITPASGYSRRYVNAGEVENKGIELLLSGSPIKTNDFQWKATLNWATNKSKIVSLYEGVDNLQLYATGSHNVTINARIGEPYGIFYGSNFEYLNGEKVVNQTTGYYEKTPTSDQKIGKMLPDWNGGFNNSFEYKNLGLSFLIDFQKGGDIFSSDMAVGSRNGLYNNTTGLNELGNPVRSPVADGGGLILEGVAPDGTKNNFRSSFINRNHALGHPTAPDAMFIYDASYIKLRELVLFYKVPTKWLKNLSIQGVELSLIGTNLWIIHKNIPHADPEAGLISGNVQGHHQGVYPSTKDIGFNVKFQF
ncbi:SusC/RagA family TonB-linked outer membrane protein [Gelidibacter sp. F63206]|uniref:SusC/RagA family TonB-linked outer membrane protein n=1 Tax=Gelidibacter sp. F63206 TaxID=2926425 RepID=UPI001FF49249|nr:SusC/RagA family TonB-linked outer membrane protein [Gelidibacter sp. F63206]MCK0114956.1 SusC/RagA family TonB-linked outer membrane protein [Gelidibacter sp. F63206]